MCNFKLDWPFIQQLFWVHIDEKTMLGGGDMAKNGTDTLAS